MYQSVMKTVSGHLHLCHAKVIQTIHETAEIVFLPIVKRLETFCCVFYSVYLLCIISFRKKICLN